MRRDRGQYVYELVNAGAGMTGMAKGASLLPKYQTKDPRTGLQRYDDEEYERRALGEAQGKLNAVRRAPLADRKEAQEAFYATMRDDPELVAERLGWLLGGSYGYGEKLIGVVTRAGAKQYEDWSDDERRVAQDRIFRQCGI